MQADQLESLSLALDLACENPADLEPLMEGPVQLGDLLLSWEKGQPPARLRVIKASTRGGSFSENVTHPTPPPTPPGRRRLTPDIFPFLGVNAH
jgi:hypothetical protein